MKRKQTLLVAMTALFCAFGAGRLWAASAEENLHLNTNVRIESITKLKPMGATRDEVYFDVVLADASGRWEITGQSFDASSGERPYLILQMPLRGKSVKPAAGAEAETLVETPTAVAYYVGAGASANTMRFVYVVRPGDMSTNITWKTQDTNKLLIGGKIGSVTLSVLDTVTGSPDVGGGRLNLTEQVMQCATGLADTAADLPVSGYTITVGDSENNNFGMLYEGLVPVTVTAIASDAGTRSVITDNALVSRGSFWVEDANSNYYNVGATLMSSDASTIKEANFNNQTATAFDANYAAKVSGLNVATTLSQKFFVNIPKGLAGTAVRLCYGIRPDTTTAKGLYAYADYTVEETPITDVTKGYAVRNTNMATKQITLPNLNELKDGYTGLAGQLVDGGEVVVSSGEKATFTIAKNGVEDLAGYGTLYASIEQISATNAANAKFERYYVPIDTDATTGDYKVALTIGDVGNVDNSSTYYRIRVPALETANTTGAIEKPFYLKITATPKRERIQLISSEVTTSAGTEYYQPIDTTMGQTPGSHNVLEYTLSVAASEEDRYFLIYPTDATYTHHIDKDATIAGVVGKDGSPLSAQKLLASYVTLQAQGGSVLPNGQVELRLFIPAGETSAKFYVACVNDYAMQAGMLTSEVTLKGVAESVRLGGAIFTAKRCNSQNEIIGMLDECSPIVPTVQNRAPTILSFPAQLSAQTGEKTDFTFSVADARTDYLIFDLTYGDGTKDSVLLVDEDAMIATMGQAAWNTKKTELSNRYGIGESKELKIETRTADTQTYTFTHAYMYGTVQNWSLTVTDSSNVATTCGGVVNLQSAQLFQFNTIYNPTAPASGYVLWDNDTDSISNWTFGTTYTSNSLAKNGGSSLVTVVAKPLSAGFDDPALGDRFRGPSEVYDSFFYMWAASGDYEALLPTGPTEEYRRYEEILSFNRAYVKEGEATDPLTWQDIQLSAIFVSEYLPNDAWESYAKDFDEPYLYELGDYNRDGVPDGWVLRHMGEGSRAEMVEGASISAASPDGSEHLPRAGWGAGDAAYRFGNSKGTLGGSLTLDGAAFGYVTRIRGRDAALNAANGRDRDADDEEADCEWLSIPVWVVQVHPEFTSSDALITERGWPKYGMVNVGRINNDEEFEPAWTKITLYPGSNPGSSHVMRIGEGVAFTENGIPYSPDHIETRTYEFNDQIVEEKWATVLDADGHLIAASDAESAPYHANNLRVCITRNENYEAFDYTYDGWIVTTLDVNNHDVPHLLSDPRIGALPFPFVHTAEIPPELATVVTSSDQRQEYILAMGSEDNVVFYDDIKGIKFCDKYCYTDRRGVAGMMIDEPFKNAYFLSSGYLDPRFTSWLDRFPVKGAADPTDSDGDGIKNAAEYYFWYYASRIVYGSVFYQNAVNEDGTIDPKKVDPETVQLNTAIWPAIDMRKRRFDRMNTDDYYGTNAKFTMGRRYNDNYDPYLAGKSFYGVPEYNPLLETYHVRTYPGDISVGEGNYWTAIPAVDVFNAFHPCYSSGGGDIDNDGLSAAEELAIGTNPIDCDTDGDWMLDSWEVMHDGLDPFANDAEENPDNDYFACGAVLRYPDYHHLFKVTYKRLTAEQVAYYDHEAKAVYLFDKETLDESLKTKGFCEFTDVEAPVVPWDEAKENVEAWVQEVPIYLRGEPEFVMLRDVDVYHAFGFNSRTAVSGGTNTAPFSNREEFNSAIVRQAERKPNAWQSVKTSPISADTNGDGMPDGWTLYLGMTPYRVPNVTPHGECDADGDDLTGAEEYAHNFMIGWTNKTAPTDPWNPDTDFDGLWDGDEGSTKFIYGMPKLVVEEADGSTKRVTYIAGGGCNPNNPDTDGDGMTDAWEFYYGRSPLSVSNALPNESETDEEEDEDEPVIALDNEAFTYVMNGVTVVYSSAPDPTRNSVDDNKKRMSDYDLDADCDGLTNYQEYLTAAMRHYRYDLCPDMARLHLESAGELQKSTVSANAQEWVTLPDAYVAGVDLKNPGMVPSTEFYRLQTSVAVMGETMVYTMTTKGEVSLLAQAMATAEYPRRVTVPTTVVRDIMAARYIDAITTAYNYNWNSTIAFPTAKELTDYGLSEIDPEAFDVETNPDAIASVMRLQTLADAFMELDMAWNRLLTISPLRDSSQYSDGGLSNSTVTTVESELDGYNAAAYRARTERQVRILITIIDELLLKLKANAAAGELQPVMAELLKDGGETHTIWKARRGQILKALIYSYYNNASEMATDPVYIGNDGVVAFSEAWAREFGKDPYRDGYKCLVEEDYEDIDMAAYERAVWNATNPLIRSRYRAAMRGFTGGLWETAAVDYFAPINWHAPMKSFSLREENVAKNKGTVLGVPLSAGATSPIGADEFPGWNPKRCEFLTTSPVDPDTDLDGMDDYYEIFHGLNPVLGDWLYDAWQDVDRNYTGVNRLANLVVTSGDSDFAHKVVTPTANAFMQPSLDEMGVTGYDYYTYPWLAGAPFTDPDGDGLLNSEEAVNPVNGKPARYGTDPSPLWMTDVTNVNSFVSRFYAKINAQMRLGVSAKLAPKAGIPYVAFSDDEKPGDHESVFAYEVNEGYDTDGDGVGDLTELTSNSVYRGDPQALRTPDRQQAAYFGGEGVMQTMADTQFGPQALTTFTIECWVKPDADQLSEEVILVDRPWRFTDGTDSTGVLRHNFVLGLRKDGTAFRPFAYYTGAGTNTDGSENTPKSSPEVVAGQTIQADEWNHLAVTYDGTRLALILNGVESESQASALIPANGIISIKSTVESDLRRFTYRKAPIMIGATAAQAWFATLGDPEDESDFATYFTKPFKGFLDEVRIWNGARTAGQIAEARSRNLTQTEMLTARLAAFNERYNGMGYFQVTSTPEPLAVYTFNDLLGGTRILATETEEAKVSPVSWERFPGDQIVGDDTVPGSLMFRRTGFRANREAAEPANPRISAQSLPKEEDLFTSYYTLEAAKNLRSKHYAENRAKDSLTLIDGAEAPITEFVPLAHNTVAHLPLADVQRKQVFNYMSMQLKDGSPDLLMPSGSAGNLKVADSYYWSPYRSGTQIYTEPTYDVKTTGNPYGYVYYGTMFFDVADYVVRPAFSSKTHTDLLIYGDVYAKYDFATWDGSPATDPAAGSVNGDDPNAAPVVKEASADWFRHQDTPGVDSGSKLNDKQFSQGAYWLEQNIAIGQTKDSDSDRMPNWWENYYGLDPENPIGINGPHGDQDGDFLTNYAEYLASANPQKFSTVGNGVPDYQIPIWFRRGAPTFGTLYTDNDFMEDHWEASNRNERLTVDLNDGYRDADDDGWSNFAEARANFRSGYHSTNPNAATSISQTGKIKLEMPTPALRMTVDYFGDQNVYTNATANAKIVVHAYTAKNNNSAPDATFKLPLATTESGEEQATIEHEVGEWKRGIMSGYLHIGNIKPGSLSIKFTRMAVDKADSSTTNTSKNENEHLFFTIHSDTKTVGDVAELYYNEPVTWIDEAGNPVADGTKRLIAGTVNYRTGEFTLDFSDAEEWAGRGYYEAEDGSISFYERSEFVGVATYSYGVVPGKSNTFTLVKPDEGYIKEGLNNFFIFADLDGDGKWDDNEPAGIPDQHDVDVGFDQVNDVLHVAMTRQAPPGTVRLDVESILGVLMTENETNNELTGDFSSIINPSTHEPLNPSLFVSNQNYWICLRVFENIGMTTQAENPGMLVYSKQFNVNKPYLSEDEIFGNAETRTGLPRSEAEGQVATSYKVYLLPETKLATSTSFDWNPYNIAVVTNVFGSLDAASTSLVAPVGGTYLHNADITFEWKSNVQVPAFGLTITKVADAAGTTVNEVVYSDLDIRGVSPSAMASGTGAVEQFIYRYKLPRGVGELDGSMRSLFGDGQYAYTLTLIPYSGSKTVLSGAFNIQLNASGDKELAEMKDAVVDSNFNMQDSYYVRAQVRYNGVLKESADFDYRRFVVEAHYSGSFNGDPVASTSDKLGYDDEEGNEAIAALNRCVKMVKDKTEDEGFFSTRFDVELRGLSTNRPVYLMAYFDLNGNGKRDVWEPWGYATQGLDAVGGFYFDPRAITPMSNGTAWNAEFYIQDVDADSDKLADAWEWLTNGQRDTASFFEDGTAGSGWCNTFTGSAANLTSSAAIWTKSVDGKVALTAYGAQLYGLTVEGTPDANGAVKIAGVEDMSAAKELLDLLGNDVAIDLINKGYTSYGLTVNNIAYDGDVITLGWNVESAVGTDGMVYDLTEAFADGNNKLATYTVYGTATLGGAWTKLAEVKVQGALDPAVKIATGDAMINDTEKACFFKVILSAKPMEATIE